MNICYPNIWETKDFNFYQFFPIICYPKFEITSGMKWFDQRKKVERNKFFISLWCGVILKDVQNIW